MEASKPDREEERLAALYRYDILDAPLEEEFEDVTRLIARFCDAPIAVINLIDRDRQWFVSEVGLGVRQTPLDVSICAHAILQPDLFIVPDTLEDERFSCNPLVVGDPHLRFYAGALLKTGEGYPLGTLCVLDYQTRNLTEAQKELLQVLANQIMKQLDLRRLLREQAKIMAEREEARAMLDAAYAHEKQIAETLQLSLLMDVTARSFFGLEVVPLYEAAWSEADVGGDFYDAFAVGEDKVALVVGDVAGKGLGAAARTAEVKYALRAFLQEYPDPASALARLNNFLCRFHDFQREDHPRFVVVALGVLDVRSGELIFASAGAEPPLVLRRGGTSEIKPVSGLPLGIDADVEYQTFAWILEHGDILLLTTDGLSEARQGTIQLEQKGVLQLAVGAEKSSISLRQLGETIMQGVKAYASGSLRDDACLLLARRP